MDRVAASHQSTSPSTISLLSVSVFLLLACAAEPVVGRATLLVGTIAARLDASSETVREAERSSASIAARVSLSGNARGADAGDGLGLGVEALGSGPLDRAVRGESGLSPPSRA